jgi:hypothetical protein
MGTGTHCERVGWTVERVGLQARLRYLGIAERTRDKPRTHMFGDLVFTADMVAVAHYLVGDVEASIKYGRQAVTDAVTYFTHVWPPEIVTRVAAGTHAHPWMTAYEGAIRWGTALSMWEELSAVARGMRLIDRRQDIGFTKGAHALYLASAASLRDEPFVARTFAAEAATETDVLAATLARGLLAVLDGDVAQVTDQLSNHLERCSRSTSQQRELTKALSPGGTFLFHFARYHGVRIELAPSLADYIVRL